MHTIENIQQPSLLAVQSHSDSQLNLIDGRLEGLELMHTLDAKIHCHLASYNSVVFTSYSSLISQKLPLT